MNKYVQTDQQLHLLGQIIAKANRTFVPQKDDDSHTNLYFDALDNRMTGRWITTEQGRLLFTLALSSQQLEIIDQNQRVLATIPTVSFSVSEIEKRIEQILPEIGLAAADFSEPLHFDIPDYDFAGKPTAPIEQSAQIEWMYYRRMANQACEALLGHAQVSAEVRIWPHHFDTGIYTMVKSGLGIGFGLAMADDMIKSPYFYMSAYPEEGEINYTQLPPSDAWQWKTAKNFKGAVLPLEQLADKTTSEQQALLQAYIRTAFHWFIRQI